MQVYVDPTNECWRIGLDGWEHNCPGQYPVVGHSPSERIPKPESTVIEVPVFNYETHAS